MGMTGNKEIPMVKSLMDYLGRWLALKFLPKDIAKKYHNGDLVERSYAEGTKSREAFVMKLPVIDEGSPDFSPHGTLTREERAKREGFSGSMCAGCGSVRMKRNGSCEVCLDCGETSGCG